MAILDPHLRHARYAQCSSSRRWTATSRSISNCRDDQRSIGLLSVDNDDATYTAIDEATKMANVEVVYARSFYAGAKHTSGKWSGEIMAILAGPDPAEVRAGLNAAVDYIKTKAIWYSANDDDSIAFFPHVISQDGHLSFQGLQHPGWLADRLSGRNAERRSGRAGCRAQVGGRYASCR